MKENILDTKTTKWINNSRDTLQNYENDYLALALDKNDNVIIVSHSNEYNKVVEEARNSGYDYIIYKFHQK